MGLAPGTRMEDVAVENIFIGSCTNSRIEDLRVAADVVRGRKVAGNVRQALVVPGSGLVKRQAEAEGLDRIFIDAGFEWPVGKTGLFHVPGHEPRSGAGGRALRQHLESQFRWPAGPGRAHPFVVARDGGSGGNFGASCRCSAVNALIRTELSGHLPCITACRTGR